MSATHDSDADCYRLYNISVDESAGNQGYEVFYEVKELRRVAGGISTMVGTNDGSLVCISINM